MEEKGNTYFGQLKKQIEGSAKSDEKSDDAYKKEQEILKKLEEEKEIPAPKEEKALPSGNESALDKLKKISGKKEEAPQNQKKENTNLDFSAPVQGKGGITWLNNKIEAQNETAYKHEFVENKPEEIMAEDGKKLEPEEKSTINTGKSVVDEKFFEPRKDSSDLDWLKREIIEEPEENDFAEKQKETQKNETPKSKWGYKEKKAEEKGKQEKSSNEKDKQESESEESPSESTGEKEKPKKSKWASQNIEAMKLEKENSEQGSIPKEETDGFVVPKWASQKKPLTKEEVQKFHTSIDDLFEELEKYKQAELGELARYASMDELETERILKMFEDEDIIQITYPTSLSKGPSITLKNPIKSKILEKPEGKTLDSYSITIDHVPANITVIISQQEGRPTYCIELPAIGKYTKKFLDFIKNEIAEGTVIELEEIIDPKKSLKLKERFFTESRAHLEKYFPKAGKETLDMLGGVIMHEMYGLGEIELLIGDDQLEEIAINSAKTPITVYHRIHGWLKTNLYPGSEDEITNYASQIGRKVGREITTLSPILDAHLLTGDRVNATLFPISAEGNTITIRRFARKPWTLVDFIGKSHTMNSEMAALLWLAIQYEMNIIIAGGTASGKTSALNTLLALVPSYHRVISIEDVREIVLPHYLNWNWIPMITRSPNPEGLGEVTMLELMVSSLRMRPDRIIVGEIRRKKEAEVLMEAIETGHSIYSTIHANSAYQVLRRLAEPPMSIPLMQIELIDLIVVQFRDRKTNKRRTYELAEIEQTSTGKGLQINTVYKWIPRSDTWEKLNKPNKILTMLNLHTGLTEDEIEAELRDRAEILEWMKKNNMNDLDMIGYLVKMFYADSGKIKKLAKQNASYETISKMMDEEKQERDKEAW